MSEESNVWIREALATWSDEKLRNETRGCDGLLALLRTVEAKAATRYRGDYKRALRECQENVDYIREAIETEMMRRQGLPVVSMGEEE